MYKIYKKAESNPVNNAKIRKSDKDITKRVKKVRENVSNLAFTTKIEFFLFFQKKGLTKSSRSDMILNVDPLKSGQQKPVFGN